MKLVESGLSQIFLLIIFLLGLNLNAFAQEEEDIVDYRNLINVRIGLGWFMDMDKYDTNGTIDTYLPFYQFPEDGAAYLTIKQNVPFENISGTARFVVPETNYGVEGGLIKRIKPNLLGSIFYRRQGTAKFDTGGAHHLDLIGGSILTEDYLVRDFSHGLKWKLSLSGSTHKVAMDGHALLESGFIYNLWHKRDMGLSLEGELDTLITSNDIETDLEIGPNLSFYGANGTVNSIVLRYIADSTTLNINDKGFYLGVMVEAGAPLKEEESVEPQFMDYGGMLTFGFGEGGRVLADIDLLGNIPAVSRGYQGITFAYEAQSFYLTGSDDNLYYVTVGGLEKEWNGYSVGFYFNHRSGHLVDSSNEFGKDDLNVYEIGISSPGWHLYRNKKEGLTFGRIGNLGRINFLARVGTNADNTFVSRWHVDAKLGLRLDLDKKIFNLTPYLSNYDEIIGDAVLHDTTIGLRQSDGWAYNLKYHYDDQISATKNGALLLTIGKIF
ncbi:MAG: hypothetical protein ISS46_02735 [Candidatus Omnitrophica bacterium]|nr:hypothetical protein [Candidatus Omnitrophota bacterium]